MTENEDKEMLRLYAELCKRGYEFSKEMMTLDGMRAALAQFEQNSPSEGICNNEKIIEKGS